MTSVIGTLLEPADKKIVDGAISAMGGSLPGDTVTLFQFITLLMLGYELKRAGRPIDVIVNKAMPAIYGTGGKDGICEWTNGRGVITSDQVDDACIAKITDWTTKISTPSISGQSDRLAGDLDTIVDGTNWFQTDYGRIAQFANRMARKMLRFFRYNVCGNIASVPADLGKLLTNPTLLKKATALLVQASTLSWFRDNGNGYVFPAFNPGIPDANVLKQFTDIYGAASPADRAKIDDAVLNSYDPENPDTAAAVWESITNPPAQAPAGQQAPASPANPNASGPQSGSNAGTLLTGSTKEHDAEEKAFDSDAMPCGLDRRSYLLIEKMAVDDDQLVEAIDALCAGKFRFAAYLTTYQPGLSEKAAAMLLDSCTTKASHRQLTKADIASATRKHTSMIPPAFKEDRMPAIWTRAVITSLGYPFINFTCPSIMELLRGTDPRRIKDAYKNVKAMFKQCRLKKPIETLKEFASSDYRNCVLNALTVDSRELFSAESGASVTASVVNPYSKTFGTKGTLNVPVDFLTAFYNVLSPVSAAAQYCEALGITKDDYQAQLDKDGRPPIYILNPKKAAFRRGPKGSLLHELFSSKAKPVLVRARVSSHDGGFIIPERIVDLLFST